MRLVLSTTCDISCGMKTGNEAEAREVLGGKGGS